jgi:hypothetical protein
LVYLLDANVLIRAHEDYYPIDRVPQFWEWLIKVAGIGHVKMPFEIHGEISISNGPLRDWICDGAVKSALILEEEVDANLLDQVLTIGYGGPLTDSDLDKIGQDPFLVAYALIDAQRVVVTKENSKPSAQKGNRKIPDVCNSLGVKWTRDFELYRLLDFNTARK